MTVNPSRSYEILREQGYSATNRYSDGSVRMARRGDVFVFLRADGTVTPPTTWELVTERCVLREAGLEVRSA